MLLKNLPFVLAPLPLLISLSAVADTTPAPEPQATQLPEIIVTASRTHDRPSAQAQIVVDRDDIDQSTATNLSDLLRQIPGVQIRQLYGIGSSEASVDVGGFGPTAGQNTLILIDGQRQNDIDLSAADIGGISLENVERIEVSPGSGGVLYGEGAVGGTVNIVTRNQKTNETLVKVGLGSYHDRETRITNQFVKDATSGQLFVSNIDSDGYRQNEALKRTEAGGKISHDLAPGEAVYASLLTSNEDSGFPGPVSINASGNQLITSPRTASSLTDYGQTQRVQSLVGWRKALTDDTSIIVEGGYKQKEQKAVLSTYVDTTLATASFTPRLENKHALGSASGQLITGIDYLDSRYDSNRQNTFDAAPFHVLDASSKSGSVYAQENLVEKDTKLTLGVRQTRDRIKARDTYDVTADPYAAFGADGQAAPFQKTYKGEFYEAALSQKFTRTTEAGIGVSHSTRLPTLDEFFQGYGPSGSPGGRAFSPLNAQTNRNYTTFVTQQVGKVGLRADAYYNRINQEIYYDPNNFINRNYDAPTVHKGVNLSATAPLGTKTSLTGNIGYQSAKFKEGANSGATVPLVARHTGGLALTHDINTSWQLGVSSQYNGERYLGDDATNTFGIKIPAMVRTDASVKYRYQKLTLTGTVRNLTNERGQYEYGYNSVFTPGSYNAYPLPGRNILMSAEYRF